MIISRVMVPFVSTIVREADSPTPVRQIALEKAHELEAGPVRFGESYITDPNWRLRQWGVWCEAVGIDPGATKGFVAVAGDRHLVVWQSEQKKRPRMWSLYVITVDTDIPPFPGEDQ